MSRKFRIATVTVVVVSALAATLVGGAYYAAQQVRPFYAQALHIEPEMRERGTRELESRATALYSDVKQVGPWKALFTAEQINCWLATQLDEKATNDLPKNVRDPRVAIERDVLTLGFRTVSGGVETVISVDAAVSLSESGAVAIRLISVRAGALPLPVLQLADELAEACKKMKLPVVWTQQDGKPVALVEFQSNEPVYVDAIQLDESQLYVAGHTERGAASFSKSKASRPKANGGDDALEEFELRLTPKDERAGLEIARRPEEQR